MVYLIGGVMLLSAFFMGTRTSEPLQSEETLSGLIQYDVALIGNASALVAVSSSGGDYVVIPSNTRPLTPDAIAYVVDNNISGVLNSTLEYTNAYIFFRFCVLDSFENESAIRSLLDREIRRYTLYRVYDGDASGVSVELVGTPDLSSGDVVKAILFRRSDNGKIIAIQESKVAPENKTAGGGAEADSTAGWETPGNSSAGEEAAE